MKQKACDSRMSAAIASGIKDIRRGLGVSQKKMAENLGISTNFFAMLERGERNPSISLLEQIWAMGKETMDGFPEIIASHPADKENGDIYLLLLETYGPEETNRALMVAKEYLESCK